LAHVRALGPRAVHEKLHGACRHAEHDAESVHLAFRVESQQATCRRGGAEGPARGGGMEAAVVVRGRIEREAQADLHLVARDDGRDQRAPVRARHFRSGQRSGHDRRAWMQRAGRMRIVEVKRVGERAIHHRGARGAVAGRIADHRTRAVGKAQPTRCGDHGRRGLGFVARPHHDAGEIEHERRNALAHCDRQFLKSQFVNESSERAGGRHEGLLLPRGSVTCERHTRCPHLCPEILPQAPECVNAKHRHVGIATRPRP
jgi:hypothetical protein